MNCEKCRKKMKEGFALVPVWGRTDGKPVRPGDTVNMVGSSVEEVKKCPECGHSVLLKKE
jgi:hypothetical protein